MAEPQHDSESYDRGKFEGALLSRLSTMCRDVGDIKTWVQQQEARIRSVEQEQSKVKGVAIAVGAVAGILSSLVQRLWK